MANDASYGPPTQKAGGTILGMPYWMVGLGVGAVVLYLWYRNRSTTASASSANTAADGTTAVIDPNTGLPVDPTTGLPYLTSAPSTSTTTMSGWLTAAEAALAAGPFTPSNVNKALYDYTNGNNLSHADAAIINYALGKVGQPPSLLPFNGPAVGNTPPKLKIVPPRTVNVKGTASKVATNVSPTLLALPNRAVG